MVHIRTQNFTFQLALEGGRGCNRRGKKLDCHPDRTTGKTKAPDDYDDRNIPEVYICQETDLWQ